MVYFRTLDRLSFKIKNYSIFLDEESFLMNSRESDNSSIGPFPVVRQSKVFSHVAGRAFPQPGCLHIQNDRHSVCMQVVPEGPA